MKNEEITWRSRELEGTASVVVGWAAGAPEFSMDSRIQHQNPQNEAEETLEKERVF